MKKNKIHTITYDIDFSDDYLYDDFPTISNLSSTKKQKKKELHKPLFKKTNFSKPTNSQVPIYDFSDDYLYDDFPTISNSSNKSKKSKKAQKIQKTKIKKEPIFTRKSTRTTPNNIHTSSSKNINIQQHNLSNDSKKFHIVINPSKGDYTLLDKNLNIVDSIHKNPALNFFTKKSNLKKFKRQLTKDYRAYKKYCKKNKIPLDSNLKEINHHIKYCLSLCPDADYQILTLLRNNVQKVDPSYGNYQTACAQYLHELAVDFPYPSRMPFDLNYSCDVLISNHKRIANIFEPSDNPVATFRKYYVQRDSTVSVAKKRFKTPNMPTIPPKKELDNAKFIRTPNVQNLER